MPFPVGPYPNDLKVVGPHMEPIKGLKRDRVKVMILVDRPRVEVYQHAVHPNLFQDMGGKIGLEFLYHARRSWMRRLAHGLPSLSCNSCAKEVLGVVKPLLLNEGSVFANEAELLVFHGHMYGQARCRPSILSLSTCIYPMGVILTHYSHITPFRPF